MLICLYFPSCLLYCETELCIFLTKYLFCFFHFVFSSFSDVLFLKHFSIRPFLSKDLDLTVIQQLSTLFFKKACKLGFLSICIKLEILLTSCFQTEKKSVLLSNKCTFKITLFFNFQCYSPMTPMTLELKYV